MSMVRVYFYEYAYGVGFGIAYPRMRGLYQSLICGMSDEFQDPALFCMAFYDKVGTSGLGFAGKILF